MEWIKKFKRLKVSNLSVSIHGLWLTRWFATVLLIPIVVAVWEISLGAYIGILDNNTVRIIDYAIKIIDHIYVPSVLASLVGYLALFIDKDNNGISDVLEKENTDEGVRHKCVANRPPRPPIVQQGDISTSKD